MTGLTPRRWVRSGSPFEEDIGYARAVVQGPWVFVSGTTGFDYGTMTIAEDVTAQAEQCFVNIAAALHEAGAAIQDVVRVQYIVTERADWSACWPVTRRWLKDVQPAATMIVAGLQDPRMRIEIEVTALRQNDSAANGPGDA